VVISGVENVCYQYAPYERVVWRYLVSLFLTLCVNTLIREQFFFQRRRSKSGVGFMFAWRHYFGLFFSHWFALFISLDLPPPPLFVCCFLSVRSFLGFATPWSSSRPCVITPFWFWKGVFAAVVFSLPVCVGSVFFSLFLTLFSTCAYFRSVLFLPSTPTGYFHGGFVMFFAQGG